MSAHTIKLDHVSSIIKFTPDTVGAGGTWKIGLGTTGYSGQTVGSGGTVGLVLFASGDAETIDTPKVHLKRVRWSAISGTSNGIRITRNNKDTLELFTSGELELGSLAENETSDITVTIDGSGTLILDLAKRAGYEKDYTNELYRQNLNPIYKG
jgi:hypothetical protein